jgi:AcrR family transcriptional regulator
MNQAYDKRTMILSAATELFSHFGFTKTSMDDIARRAKIGKATIYYYFPRKEDLFLEAVAQKAEEFFALLKLEISAQEGFERKLSAFLHLPVHYVVENMPILAESMREIAMFYQERIEAMRLEYRNRMYELLQGIMEDGKSSGIINRQIDSERFSEVINDWFLMGDTNFVINNKEALVRRIDRDHELIIQLILYGIIKRS